MSLRLRRIVAFPLLVVLTPFVAGCGGDSNPPTVDLPAQIANDVAAALGGMLATDNGGWMTEVKTSFDTTPRTAPGAALARFGGGPSILSGDTTFVRGSMNWSLNYTYYDALDVASETFGPTTVRAIVRCEATGNVPVPGGGTTHVYAHLDSMHVDNMRDTLITYGAITNVDSAFVSLGGRYYMFDNLVEYTLDMRQHPVAAWPVSGEALVDVFLDVLRTPGRNDRSGQYDVVMTIAFDGTQTPIATVHLNRENPVSIYRYRIDLRTGAITPNAAPGVRIGGLTAVR